MDTDTFLGTLFSGAQGAVVTANKEDGYESRRWTPGKEVSGVAYFCISTVKDNSRARVLSRKTPDLVRTYVIILDDVGTKVDQQLIKAPWTYRLESSPNNFQIGFKIKGGVEPERAAALLEALAKAGLTDPGAIRADRIMRVPGSLNDKYDPPFEARVVTWNPEIEYTFSELCVALGVTPTDVRQASAVPTVDDEQDDLVFQWLVRNNWLTGGKNPRGWYPLMCPNRASHSGDIDHGTDYLPGRPGVFKCMHAHCQHIDNGWIRNWIRRQDPDAVLSEWSPDRLHDFGRRLAAALGVPADALERDERAEGSEAAGRPGAHPGPNTGPGEGRNAARSKNTSSVLDILEAQTAAQGSMFNAVRPDQDDVETAVLNDLIHVASEDAYWSEAAGGLVKHRTVDDRWYTKMRRAGLLDSITPAGSPTVIAPHIWLRRHPGTQRATRIVNRLGKPRLFEGCLNVAPELPPVHPFEGEPTLWLELVDFLMPEPADADWFIDWCAMMVGAPEEKPGWHVILQGHHGTGKNLVLSPLVSHYQAAGLHETVNVSAITSGFNAFLAAKMISVDELKQTSRGSATPHDTYATIKAWTARQSGTITVNQKYRTPYEVENLSGWAITSNEAIPLAVEQGDRRFFVVRTPREPMEPERYRAIVDWLEQGAWRQTVGWLQNQWVEMSAERRAVLRGRAPMTGAKEALIDASSEGINGAVRLAIEGKVSMPWPDLMRLEDVIAKLEQDADSLLTESMRKAITSQRVIAALKEAGAERVHGGKQVEVGERRIRLWCLTGKRRPLYEQLGQGKALMDKYDELQKSPVLDALKGVVKFPSPSDRE